MLLVKIQEIEQLEQESNFDEDTNCELLDLLDDLYNLRQVLLSRFDQYLKFQVQKRGITVIQNTYTGFDCEYQLDDARKFKNRLLSTQTAVQRRTIVKVPLYNPYDISYVHPLDSQISNIYKNKVDLHEGFKYTFLDSPKPGSNDSKKRLNELKVINNCLKYSITNIRKMLFQSVDEVNSSIIEALKGVEGVSHFEDLKHDQIVFVLPLTPLITKIDFPTKGFCFGDLLRMSDDSSSSPSPLPLAPCPCPLTLNCRSSIKDYIDTFRGVTLPDGRVVVKGSAVGGGEALREGRVVVKGSAVGGEEALREGGYGVGCVNKLPQIEREPSFGKTLREDFVSLIKLISTLGLKSDPLKFVKWFDNTKFKPRCRSKVVFDNGANISLSIVKNNYILAHYNAADLSMLDDFEDLKKNLSIVNKSFVSLGKPLRFESAFVYVRDTILLAPAGKGSLSDLGKLYDSDGDFNKRVISKDDLNNMSAFLKRDPEAFKEYAIQDAVITLKHALSMENFNMSIKQLGVPLTLSSIGRNYVFEE